MSNTENLDRFVAKFEVCDLDTFKERLPEELMGDAEAIHGNLKLPLRGTKGSAGYDILAPFDITFIGSQYITIPTGLKTKIRDGWVGLIMPRSGLGFKYGLRLANTVGVIDSDYEGQILIRLKSDSTFTIKHGEGFAQILFLPFGLAADEKLKTTAERGTGGFGSTD